MMMTVDAGILRILQWKVQAKGRWAHATFTPNAGCPSDYWRVLFPKDKLTLDGIAEGKQIWMHRIANWPRVRLIMDGERVDSAGRRYLQIRALPARADAPITARVWVALEKRERGYRSASVSGGELLLRVWTRANGAWQRAVLFTTLDAEVVIRGYGANGGRIAHHADLVA